MAAFMTDLWESIFVPGPTTTLIVATNASFAALQVILLALFIATYSVHFVVLSILCAGLWWSINWFANEVAIAQQEKERKEAREERDKGDVGGGGGSGGAGGRPETTEDSDTEVEESKVIRRKQPSARKGAGAGAGAAASEVEALEQAGELKHRGGVDSAGGTQSSVSTEDEWEKVSENEQEKDK